mmetsp:Transcript_35541/g.42425  ORF Transcript_35541/g.42425 Transcript_35541/m.42425 type:complete len:217 (-) Transcript_35541:266-916(-)
MWNGGRGMYRLLWFGIQFRTMTRRGVILIVVIVVRCNSNPSVIRSFLSVVVVIVVRKKIRNNRRRRNKQQMIPTTINPSVEVSNSIPSGYTTTHDGNIPLVYLILETTAPHQRRHPCHCGSTYTDPRVSPKPWIYPLPKPLEMILMILILIVTRINPPTKDHPSIFHPMYFDRRTLRPLVILWLRYGILSFSTIENDKRVHRHRRRRRRFPCKLLG